jgi:predicted metal-binding membrane protein
MVEPGLTERVLRREQWIVGGCLLLIVALAWAWLFHAQAGMAPGAGPQVAAVAAMAGEAMPPSPPPLAAYFAQAAAMWFLMMTAMMLPSAAPMILLYGRFARGVADQGGALAPTALFGGSYLAVWAGFSLAAAGLQAALVHSGVISQAELGLGDRRIAGALLLAVGLYQLTPLKRACLEACRSPIGFLTRYWRPSAAGALRLGVRHGAYCVGCCWLIMALLFIGGVMSLTWVAALALVVLIEKATPFGPVVGRAAGVAALAYGAALLFGLRLPL